jgi:predicted NBD/HSP70 family sugar kinase
MPDSVLHPSALRWVGPDIARYDSETRLILAIHRRGLTAANGWLDKDFQGLSQGEAVALTGLSQASVSTLAKGLRERELLLEKRGLVLDPTAGIAFGIDIGFNQIRVTVSDLHGQLIAENLAVPPIETELGVNASMTLDEIERRLRALEDKARRAGARDAKIIGVGITLAGAVDRDSGKLVPALGIGGDWQLLSAAGALKHRLGWDTDFITDREANASVTAEVLWGADRRETPHIIYCKWAEGGVSAAVIFDHQILYGNGYMTGEIAHSVVPFEEGHELDDIDECLKDWFNDGPPCPHCKRRRCLWAVTSLGCLEKFVGVEKGGAGKILDLARSYDASKHRRRHPEHRARHALMAASRCLGRVLRPSIEMFAPMKVILGGKIGAPAFQTVNSSLIAGIAEQGISPAIAAADVTGASAGLTGRSSVRGAVALALIQGAPDRLHELARARVAPSPVLAPRVPRAPARRPKAARAAAPPA